MADIDQPIEALGGRTIRELETQEVEGRVLYAEKLRYRDKHGVVKEVPVWLRVPRPLEYAQARELTAKLFAQRGLSRQFDSDLFVELEQVAILSFALRDEQGAQFATFDELPHKYEATSLAELVQKLEELRKNADPRPLASPRNEEELFGFIAAVAKEQSLYPLAAIASDAQSAWLLSMAKVAFDSPTVQSWLRSTESSKQAR